MLFLYLSEEKPAVLPSAGLELHFFDVGQGDAALIVCEGETMLIDTGPADAAETLVNALRKVGVQTLDYLVCTHDHADHCGGLSAVRDAFTVDTLITQDTFAVDLPLLLGNAQITGFSPLENTEDENEASLILYLTCGEFSALFMADAGIAAEEALLAENTLAPVTVLKVGHHGSQSATGEAFLDCVQPQYAVISVGFDNDYGHPHEELLARLREYTVFRTDLQGSITFRYDGQTLTVETVGDATADTLELAENAARQEMRQYVVNLKSGVFHLPDCSGAQNIKAENRLVLTESYTALVEKGYRPCGLCDP